MKKVFHINLDAGSQTSCSEVLMQTANPGAHNPTPGTRGSGSFSAEPLQVYCWLTPIWGWSASGSSSSTSALYSSKASSSASGSPSNYRGEREAAVSATWPKGRKTTRGGWYGFNSTVTREARRHNGEKTLSSISRAEKTGRLHVEEWN